MEEVILTDSSLYPKIFRNSFVAGVCGISLSCLSLKAGNRPVWIQLEYIGDFLLPMNLLVRLIYTSCAICSACTSNIHGISTFYRSHTYKV